MQQRCCVVCVRLMAPTDDSRLGVDRLPIANAVQPAERCDSSKAADGCNPYLARHIFPYLLCHRPVYEQHTFEPSVCWPTSGLNAQLPACK